MKFSLLILSCILLSGCSLSTSREIKKAEKVLNQFECHNIESNQLNHSAITSFHEKTLASSKNKAESYVESYKAGDELFRLPLDQIVQQQYDVYKSACESLGGT